MAKFNHRDLYEKVKEFVEENDPEEISDWEHQFLESLGEQLETKDKLSFKQLEALSKIADRFRIDY